MKLVKNEIKIFNVNPSELVVGCPTLITVKSSF